MGAQYLRLHHVHSPWPQLPDTVIDVHHPFPFRHVQHDVNNDETTGPPGTSTEWKEMSIRVRKGPLCSCFFKENILLWWNSYHIKWTIYSVQASGISHLPNGMQPSPPLGSRAFSPPKGDPYPLPSVRPSRGSGHATHLQCTTNGPELGGLFDLTCRTNPSSPVAW